MSGEVGLSPIKKWEGGRQEGIKALPQRFLGEVWVIVVLQDFGSMFLTPVTLQWVVAARAACLASFAIS